MMLGLPRSAEPRLKAVLQLVSSEAETIKWRFP